MLNKITIYQLTAILSLQCISSGMLHGQQVQQAGHRDSGAPCPSPCATAPKVVVHVPEPIVEFIDEKCDPCVKCPPKRRVREFAASSIQLLPLQAAPQQVVVQQSIAPQPQNHLMNFSVSVPDNSQDIASFIRARDSLALSALRSQIQRDLHSAVAEHAEDTLMSAVDMHGAHASMLANMAQKQSSILKSREQARAEAASARLKALGNLQAQPAGAPLANTSNGNLQSLTQKLTEINTELTALGGHLKTMAEKTQKIDAFLERKFPNEYNKP